MSSWTCLRWTTPAVRRLAAGSIISGQQSIALPSGAQMIIVTKIDRRRFVKTAAASAAVSTFGGIAKPYISRASDRPVITHGVQSGDVSVDSGVVWARSDRPSRMLVEVATTDSFKSIQRSVY